MIRFDSGAIGQLVLTDVSHGQNTSISNINGSNGTLFRSQSRSGKPIKIVLKNGEEISGDKILELVPDFSLDELTIKLWDGHNRIGSYDLDFHETNSRLLAYEYLDWVRAIEKGMNPEVGVLEGKNALGLAYSIMESGISKTKVKVSDVISGKINSYQKDIDISEDI